MDKKEAALKFRSIWHGISDDLQRSFGATAYAAHEICPMSSSKALRDEDCSTVRTECVKLQERLEDRVRQLKNLQTEINLNTPRFTPAPSAEQAVMGYRSN